TTSIHGDRQQREREEALSDFKSGRVSILVATSVAARGLDIDDVRHVVNYDLPGCVDDYVHRIGRTGRIGHCGSAVGFFDCGRDRDLARPLVRVLSDAGQDVPPWLEEEASGAVGTSFGGVGGTFTSRDVRRQGSGWMRPSSLHAMNSPPPPPAAAAAAGGGGEEESWD
ncbi:putative ATP-dependent RNA helicase DDX4, partial [Petromyzon marinus]|uniref:putative ATP-dependent RNA helicase DDX4 n=1 Tax=Petromyzon marinus TaxID=7757 RepID=UPI003F7005E2